MEANDAEQQWFVGLTGVRERYQVAEDGLVLGSGAVDRWYSAIAHPELPEVVATLREASDADLVTFARTYGDMGYRFLVHDPEKAVHHRPDGRREAGGDPAWWLRGHGWSVHMCLEISDALQREDERLATDVLYEATRRVHGIMKGAEMVYFDLITKRRDGPPPSSHEIDEPFERARTLRREIINANLVGVSRAIYALRAGGEKSWFTTQAGIQAAYWHLANAVDGGVVKRCAAEGCGGVFIQTHGRQRFCPPRWRQSESPCALRERKRKARKGGGQRDGTQSE